MTAQDLLIKIRNDNPSRRFARTESEIGVWDGDRYIPCAALTLTGDWVKVPFDILVNGKRIERSWEVE